jgi:hypothetical protein
MHQHYITLHHTVHIIYELYVPGIIIHQLPIIMLQAILRNKKAVLIILALWSIIYLLVLMDPSSYSKNNTEATSAAESIPHHADAADAGRSKVQVLSTSIQNPMLSSGTISDPLVPININSTLIETKLLTEMRIQDKSSPESPFQNCSATSNAEINIHTNMQDNDTYGNMIHDGIGTGTGTGYASDLTMWILQALTKDGEKKRVGGDEFYITYTDNNVILANSTINGRDFDSNNASSKDGATIPTTLNEGNENKNPPPYSCCNCHRSS